MTASCFHGDRGSRLTLQCPLVSGEQLGPCFSEQIPNHLLLLSLAPAAHNETRLNFHEKKNPSKAWQKPFLKLATEVILSINENFPLMPIGVDKDRILLSPCLSIIPFLLFAFILFMAEGATNDVVKISCRKVYLSLFLKSLLVLGILRGRYFTHS